MPLSAPRDRTIRSLFALSMNRCAFPECTTPIVDHDGHTLLGEVCHIRAQRKGGPRYDESQSEEDRHGFDNLLLMCGVHHKLIDSPENVDRYSVEALTQLKLEHERIGRASGAPSQILSEELVRDLIRESNKYEGGSVHADFRHATFRVGGEGGSWGGGGGAGGILNIVGSTRELPGVLLDGQDGQVPGGGGGGVGSIVFHGRPADKDDIANGLRVSSIFLANAVSMADMLVNVLGGMWSYLPLPSVPFPAGVNLVAVFEAGSVAPGTLLRLQIQVICPSLECVFERERDVAIPETSDPIVRISLVQQLHFEVKAYGIWRIFLRSGGQVLAEHLFECRQGDLILTAPH